MGKEERRKTPSRNGLWIIWRHIAQLNYILPNSPTVWTAPLSPSIKINFDAAYFQIAVVARDAEGTCLGWRVRRLMGQPPAVVGEARAALETVHFARDLGLTDVIVEGDCSQCLSAIQNRVEVVLRGSSFPAFTFFLLF